MDHHVGFCGPHLGSEMLEQLVSEAFLVLLNFARILKLFAIQAQSTEKGDQLKEKDAFGIKGRQGYKAFNDLGVKVDMVLISCPWQFKDLANVDRF